jgi:hypothetical protein
MARTILAALTIAWSGVALCRTVHCSFNQHFREGGERGAEVVLTLGKDNVIRDFELTSYLSNGQEAGGYDCAVSSGKTTRWTMHGRTYLVDTSSEAGEFSIASLGVGDRNIFVVTQYLSHRAYCGFGAEWPESIAIPINGGTCRVKWP